MTAPRSSPHLGRRGCWKGSLPPSASSSARTSWSPARTTRSWAGRPARPTAATGPGRRTAFAPRTGNGGRTAAART